MRQKEGIKNPPISEEKLAFKRGDSVVGISKERPAQA